MAAAGCGQFESPPDAYVLLSANVWRPSYELSRALRLKKGALFWMFDRISRPLGYFPSQALRMGPCAESYPYISDLYRTWVEDQWTSRDGRFDFTQGMASIKAPVVSVIGRGDRLMAHPDGAKNWFDVIESDRAEFWLAEAGRFGLEFDPDHMTLVTSPKSRPLWRSVERWMRDALGVR